MSGILKRKLEEGPGPYLPLQGADNDEVSCSDSGNSSDSLYHPGLSGCPDGSLQQQSKRLRGRNVHFESVTVYYFNRWQGFTSVPTQGGSTLGMLPCHSSVRRFTLREFALEQKRKHHNILKEHLKEEKLNALRLKLTKNGTVSSVEAETLTLDDISEDDLDVDNAEVGDYFFLQPLTTSKRRALLRASGVRRIDVDEKHELRALRMSREECGCRCRGICDPETCACSLAGIKCQVDRLSFPCGCTKEGCSNTTGRLEFNPVRVRTHFLHTIMKLELEKGREEQQHRSEEQQQLVTNGNSYHGDSSFSTSLDQQQQEQNLRIPPHFPIMHLPDTGNTESHLDEEEEEEEDDEDDDEAYEEDEDGSSVCSGLSDCSTHSLDTIEGEDDEENEEEDDEEEEEEGDEEEEEDWNCSLHTGPQPYLVPLPSMLARLSPPFHNTAATQHYQPDTPTFLSDSAPTLPTVEVALESEINTELRCRTFPGLKGSVAVDTQPPQSTLTSTELQNIPDNCDSQTVDEAEQTEREEEERQPLQQGLKTQGAPSEKVDGLSSE